jgi:hypothetical protein
VGVYKSVLINLLKGSGWALRADFPAAASICQVQSLRPLFHRFPLKPGNEFNSMADALAINAWMNRSGD